MLLERAAARIWGTEEGVSARRARARPPRRPSASPSLPHLGRLVEHARVAPQARPDDDGVEAREPGRDGRDRARARGRPDRFAFGQARVHDQVGAVALDHWGRAGRGKHVGEVGAGLWGGREVLGGLLR